MVKQIAPAIQSKQIPGIEPLLKDVRILIEGARQRVAQTVNSDLVILNWSIGLRIHKEILSETRASYGQKIVEALSQQLTVQYGKGYSRDNLFRMIQFAVKFPDSKIVGAASRQLSWSH